MSSFFIFYFLYNIVIIFFFFYNVKLKISFIKGTSAIFFDFFLTLNNFRKKNKNILRTNYSKFKKNYRNDLILGIYSYINIMILKLNNHT